MMISKKRERDDSIINFDDKNSSGSEKFVISSEKNSFQICTIKNRKALSDTLKKLKNPFTILDKDIISNFNAKSKELKAGDSFKESIDFTKVDKEKIYYLDDEIKIYSFFSDKRKTENNIIFSGLDNNNNSEIDIEKQIFLKLLKFSNNIEDKCKISDFCTQYDIIFENNSIETFYKTIRRPRSYPFRYHLYTEKRIIMKLFGPRKTSKSIYLRCVLANYHFKYSIFRPTLIFDVSFISNNITFNQIKFQKAFYYELFSLFKDIYDVDEFYKVINFKIDETMDFINHIINLYFEYINKNKLEYTKPLFCIDNYSVYYDNEKSLEKIEKTSKLTKKFHLYIIYSIITQEDQAEYVKNFDTISEPGTPVTDFPCFYASSFRNLSEFEKCLKDDNIEIPIKYQEFFGDNTFYLFKYIKEGINFDDFLKIEEIEIRKEIEFFYDNTPNKKIYIDKIIDAINKQSIIYYDRDFMINIPSNYIIINKDKNTFKLEYSFPLIKSIFENMFTKKPFVIDIHNEDFLKLNDTTQSIYFDEFVNDYLREENSFFGYEEEEIEKVIDDYSLENNSINEEGDQIYKYNDVISLIKENKLKYENLSNLIKKYKGKNLLNNKKLIVVFQDFHGKFVDILLLVKKDNNLEYSIVNLQIKLSKIFKITKKDKKLEPFRMTYLQQKYQYIFDINIVDSYIIYMSIFELKRKFAEENKDICIFYSRKQRKIVDSKGNILNKFPFLNDSKVELISKLNLFIDSFKNMLEEISRKKLILSKDTKEIDNNYMKIIISKEKIKVEIKFMDMESISIRPNDNNFMVDNIYYKINIDEE